MIRTRVSVTIRGSGRARISFVVRVRGAVLVRLGLELTLGVRLD